MKEGTDVCYCRFCGAKISTEDKFCHSCGARLNAESAPEKEPQKAASEKSMDYRAFIAIGVIVLLMLAAIIVIFRMAGGSDEVVPTPDPVMAEIIPETETPMPSETTPPIEASVLGITPEQYAAENGWNWPTSSPETWKRNGPSSDWFTVCNTASMLARSLRCSTESWDYSLAYIDARVNGKSDLEAHAIGLKETGIAKKVLGRNEYSQYIYNSALAAGVSEYDAESFAEQEKDVWDAAWNIYKYARETGKSHEKATDSVEFGCFTSGNDVGWSGFLERKRAYRNNGAGTSSRANEEHEELFNILKKYFESSDLDIEELATASTGQSSNQSATAPYNGQILVAPSYERLCPFEVSVQGDDAYYVYLKYMSSSAQSLDSRGAPNTPAYSSVSDIAFYIAPNSTAEIDVPVGVYKLYYACGTTWYGLDQLFGKETLYSTSDELMEFYTDYSTAHGHSLELWSQVGGNFETENIVASQFPG